jgi:hypothetical protein
MSDSQAIAEAFFADLMASFADADKCFEPLYLAFGDGSDDSVFGVNTHPGYIFDDNFWDVFHAHPLHVCHVTRLTDGPQFDEGRVFEIRFKVAEGVEE